MPDTPPPAAPHRNQQLFSDYYLNELLPARADWQALAETARPVMEQAAALLRGFHPSSNEAQTEADFIRPLLKLLEHDFEVQPALKTPDGTKKPDYVFYRTPADLQAHKNKTLTDAVAHQGAFAVGDAKYWDRPLDSALPAKSGDLFSNKNPSYQIAFYVQHSGVAWGLLTNGRLWRLVHRDSAHKLDRFYEVDLPALLQSSDPARFLYFWAFFGRAAFTPHPLGVAAILQASEDYARGVGDTLKVQVYHALRHLAQGFLDYAPNGLDSGDADTRRDIYDNSLILLYRLLFVLYAEARDLLPVRTSPLYRDSYSLHALKNDVARDLHAGKRLLPTSATLWPRLRELFRSVDRGNPPLHVATFNGGLFDPDRHPFLEQHTVGDAHLQRALDMLARVGGQFVDYRDLSVRHLGTIYEGLLEYTLQSIPPEGDWTVALVNDKGERKATGSYYTPDYIVKYIVEQTVGPMLLEAVAGHADDAAQVQAVLGVNVLDPAMGSGHFLVEATEYIARFLVDRAVLPGADAHGEADLLYWKRRVAQSCIYGVDLNPLAVELAKLSLWLTTVAQGRPLSFLDHHLRTGNALVGARLADLQLGGKPKPKRGDTARKEADGQLSMMADSAFAQSMTRAVGSMWLIEENAAQTVADVKTQEKLYAQLRADYTARYGRLADVVTATHFGLPIQAAFWKPFADYAMRGGTAALPQFAQWLDAAETMAGERRFFHWELEFPEVFFDRFGRSLGDAAGFDAVIGNPPYVRQEELGPFKPYFAAQFPEVHSGTADLFVFFFAQALRQLQRGGRTAYISSNSWLRANYATPLRAHLRQTTTVEALVDLGDNRVFADAPDVYPAIHVVRKDAPPADHIAQVATFTRGEGLASFAEQVPGKLRPASMHDQPDAGWQLGDDAGRQVFAKLIAVGELLTKVVQGRILFGIKTGLNEAFTIDAGTRQRLLDKDANSADIIKPILRGEDLRPWYSEDEGRSIIIMPSGWTRKKFGLGLSEDDMWRKFQAAYPAVAEYLLPFEPDARKRQDQGRYWWELRPCDYYDAFERPKIFWPDIAKSPRFVWDESTTFIGNTGYFIPDASTYILGVLASRATWFTISRLSLSFGERAGTQRFRLFTQFMARLPIPDAPDAERDAIGNLATAITEQARARYALHQKACHRLLTDLGAPGARLNNKLTAWWTLDFPALRAELVKAFKTDIPLKDRDDWEQWLADRKAEHEEHTARIVAHETDLNARVYALFQLTPGEIKAVEDSTKYRYGEV